MDWSQFDNMLDSEVMGKLQDLEAGKQGGDYEKVPHGEYEVVPEKIDFGTSKKGNPMTTVWMRIVNAKDPENKRFINSMIFAHFVVSSGPNAAFGIHKSKEFIRKMDPSTPVVFESFTQWDILLKGVAEELCGNASYILKYGETVNKKGDRFDEYIITDGPFEVPKDYKPPVTESAPIYSVRVER